jgi:hypothetical protein
VSALIHAIGSLYMAFADVPIPRVIRGCPCCIDRKKVDTVLTTPLREIGGNDLSSYATSAFLTVGGAADYAYFLPRILELSAVDNSWLPDIEVTARAIHLCDPDSWSLVRQDALRRFLFAVIAEVLEGSEFDKLDSWLCAIGRMGVEVGAHLAQVEQIPAAVLAYFEWNENELRRHKKLCNAFWGLPSAAHDEIVRWLDSERVRRILFDAYGNAPGSGG